MRKPRDGMRENMVLRGMNNTIDTCARPLLQLVIVVLFGMLAFGCGSPASLRPSQSAVSAPSLGTAASFLVLGGSTVTNTGATTVYGDLGVAPGLAITGFPPGLVLGGAMHAGDATALQGQNDITAAYLVLAGEACAFDLTGQDLGGRTLTQGVYCFSSEAQLTGQLVLDAQGDPSAVFVFQIGSKLTTASNASVVFINGGQDCRTFWQVGSSATLGTDTVFAGNILALTSIALETRASVSGRALARNGAVTMDTNHVFSGSCAGGGAVVDGSVARPDAGVDGSVADAAGNDAKVDGRVADAAGNDAGSGLCCNGVRCGTSCTNVNADDANCGSCGHSCALGESCSGGSCVACSKLCGGVCVDLDYDLDNCGACGNVCLPGANCDSGSCVACSKLCGGVCADLDYDLDNCGACGNVCLPSAICDSGSCVACSNLCGGVCVDLVGDTENCGSCGHSCAWGESCVSGSCVCQ